MGIASSGTRGSLTRWNSTPPRPGALGDSTNWLRQDLLVPINDSEDNIEVGEVMAENEASERCPHENWRAMARDELHMSLSRPQTSALKGRPALPLERRIGFTPGLDFSEYAS